MGKFWPDSEDERIRAAAKRVAASLPDPTPEAVESLRFLLGFDKTYVAPPPRLAPPAPPTKSVLRPPLPPRAPVAGVYFIRSGDSIKIGMSIDVQGRMKGLQTSSPTLLELLAVVPGARAEEAALHERFAKLHERGEWFTAAPELLSYLDEIGRGEGRG